MHQSQRGLNSLYAAIHWGYKSKEKEPMSPQFQNAVGTLIMEQKENQMTNGPVNAHLISWPSKAQNIQNMENIYVDGKEMTLTFNTHIPS